MLGKKTKSGKQDRTTCGQRPKGLGGPICSRKVKRGWDTCGRPDCAAWKFCETS